MKLHQCRNYDSVVAMQQSGSMAGDYFSKKYRAEFESMRAPFSLLLDHIDYIVKLVGIDYVGLGSDFDGIDSAPVGLDGVEDYPKVTEGLLKRGYSEKDVKKILGGNFFEGC